MKRTLKSYLIVTLGTLLMSVGIYFFKFPNNFSTGGVSGISIIMTALFEKFSAAEFMLLLNVLLLIIGLIIFGRTFAFKTVYCSMLMSVATRVFEVVFPLDKPMTDQKMMELIFAIAIIAVGSALIFNEGASSGGTDIVAMILKRYTNVNIGRALLYSDAIIAGAAWIVFGTETGMYSVFGLVLKSLVVDNFIDGINMSKYFVIITSKPDEICNYIMQTIHRGATISQCNGAFTHDGRSMVMTVISRQQAVLLKRYIKEVDDHAFTIICNSSDIIGKGFRTVL